MHPRQDQLTMPESTSEAFSRGAKAGQVDAELKEHGQHLDKINGSMEKIAVALEGLTEEQHSMSKDIQKLILQAAADVDTRVALAAALKEAEAARREKEKDTAEALKVKGDNAWLPFVRIAGIVTLVAALIGMYVALRPR